MRLFCCALLHLLWLSTLMDCHRILVVMPFASGSHKNLFNPLILELADRGHHLTVISGNKKTESLQNHPNVREIVIELQVHFSVENKGLRDGQNFFESIVDEPFKTKFEFVRSFGDFPETLANDTYSNVEVQKMIKEDHFDLVIQSMMTQYLGAPFAWHFKCPFILMSPSIIYSGLPFVLGDSDHTEYVPFILSSFTDRMSLMERLINTFIINLGVISGQYKFPPMYDRVVQRYLPDCPPVLEIEKNVSLILTNTHPSFSYPRTSPPALIEIGGLHCRPAKPLPKHFSDFVEASGDDGFLLFSVGSVIQMNEMPSRIVEIFKRVFARIPQRIIWQWKNPEKVAKEMPANVLLADWLPQQDLLGHPKCKGFLTHGGLLSTQEAVYHGIPVIGLPFVTDQEFNIAKAESDGYAIGLPWSELDEDKLSHALSEILYQPRYVETVKRRQSLLRDQLQTPLERAVFWTEYTLRHKGAPALQLASKHLNRLQRNLVDVYCILALIAGLFAAIVYFVTRSLCRRLLKFLS